MRRRNYDVVIIGGGVIGCPMGCSLTVVVEEGKAVSVSGNTCGIGKRYAEQEIESPKRMVTTTVMSDCGIPVPVKTERSIPKDKIFDVVSEIKAAVITLPAAIGDVVISDAAGTGVPVIVTGDADR